MGCWRASESLTLYKPKGPGYSVAYIPSSDGEESIPLPIHAGVPQGSAPTDSLYTLIASLYEALEEVAKISVIEVCRRHKYYRL
jgi:hypothetical protein